VFPFDGAGSDDHNRSSPRALATFYKEATGTPYAQALFDSLPILGKDGSLANVLPDAPAAGEAQLKTGNRAVSTPAEQTILLGNSLAGYVEGKSGRQFTVMIAMGNMPFTTLAEFTAVTDDQAKMVELMQQAF
jgi:D-alanyl-D-alanine carboxypeptidase/D-alanyl-D-alanine-endopeptidase (penicillin-binding protein 4)